MVQFLSIREGSRFDCRLIDEIHRAGKPASRTGRFSAGRLVRPGPSPQACRACGVAPLGIFLCQLSEGPFNPNGSGHARAFASRARSDRDLGSRACGSTPSSNQSWLLSGGQIRMPEDRTRTPHELCCRSRRHDAPTSRTRTSPGGPQPPGALSRPHACRRQPTGRRNS